MHDEAAYAELQANAIGGTWSADTRTWRVRWSDRARRIHGAPPGTVPTVWQALDFIEREDRACLFRHAFACARDGVPFEIEVGLRPLQGGRVRARIVGFPSGDITGGLHSLHGTIAVVPTFAEHEPADDDGGDPFACIQEIAHLLAHELRGPMATIAGFAQGVSATEQALSPKGHARLERIREMARHLDSLVEGLMQFAPLASQARRDEDVDLGALAHECIAMLRAGDPERVVEVQIDEGLRTRGDPHLMRLALRNLLANAWKFTRTQANASIAFGIDDAASGDGSTVYVVRDNGVGFAMEDAARVFRPFERLHARDQFDGSGLGLAITRRCVERHGGSVWCSAAVGEGASFYVRLPAPAS